LSFDFYEFGNLILEFEKRLSRVVFPLSG
jgi:hypothetical protein